MIPRAGAGGTGSLVGGGGSVSKRPRRVAQGRRPMESASLITLVRAQTAIRQKLDSRISPLTKILTQSLFVSGGLSEDSLTSGAARLSCESLDTSLKLVVANMQYDIIVFAQ